jgi:hypothetical protein
MRLPIAEGSGEKGEEIVYFHSGER